MDPLTLAQKVNLTNALLLLVGVIGVTFFSVWHHSKSAYEELNTRGVAIAVIAAKNSGYAIYTENEEELEMLAADLLENKNLVSVEIINKKNELLLRKSKVSDQSMPIFKPHAHEEFEQGQTSVGTFTLTGNSTKYSVIKVDIFSMVDAGDGEDLGILDLDAPADNESEILGHIRIAMSHANLQSMLRKFVIEIMLIAAAVFLIGAIASYYLVKILTRPLRAFSAMTEGIGKGDFDQKITIGTNDEIGQLGSAFNIMAGKLRSYRNEVDKHQHTLEDKIEERTLELAEKNSRLEVVLEEAQQARQSAEEASRAKSEFLATMSHEIRTPLNGVLGMTDILSRTQLDKKQKRFVEVIASSSDTLLTLISDILDFSKIEAGMLELNYNRFNLRVFLEELAYSYVGLAEKKNLELVCRIPPRCSSIIEADSARLRQILANLVGNAIKFTQQGSIQLRVDLLGDVEGGRGTLRFEVKDTGIGIEKAKIGKVFEKFTQADGSTTRNFGGTGLGLAICKNLVNKMGGEIFIDSEVGKGSTFWFDVNVPVIEAEAISDLVGTNIGELNVLIVDDLDINREIIKDQLEAWGVDSHGVSSGPECIEELARADNNGAPYDVLIVDFHMPDMDGMELSRYIRGDIRYDNIKIIMLSSVADADPEDVAKAAGINGRLLKPVRQSDLYDSLVHLSRQEQQISTQRSAPTIAEAVTNRNSGKDTAIKVLLAEDTDVNQEVALVMLESLGCSATLVENGKQALEACRANEYDIVLMDCQMPEMDGYEVTRAIRELEKEDSSASKLIVVALTANVIEGDKEACLAAGMDDYMSKPFNLEDLALMLDKWLPKGKATLDGNSEGLPYGAIGSNRE
ncbi:MAG: response regulator [Porticoccaceae bacterium]|nr:response regulator [Porticoccaceae bacterium]